MRHIHFKKSAIFKLLTGLAVIGAFAGLSSTQQAEAAIRCVGPNQIINGHPHATPWCEDNYLARIARGYGMRVSNRAVRQNPHLKRQVCLSVGHDIRVSHICAGSRPDRGRGRIFN